VSTETANTPQNNSSRFVLLGVLLVGMIAMALVLAGSLSRSTSAAVPTEQWEGVTALEPGEPVVNFTLTNQDGQPVTLDDIKGKVTLLYFGFTHCPDVCPATMDNFKRIHQELGNQAEQVQFVFVSVDTERDTPEVIKTFLQERGVSDFVTGLTGAEADVRGMGVPFGLWFEINHAAETNEAHDHMALTDEPTPSDANADLTGGDHGGVNHTTLTYLIDRKGEIRVLYSSTTPADVILQNLRLYL
jgi:protein SCO1